MKKLDLKKFDFKTYFPEGYCFKEKRECGISWINKQITNNESKPNEKTKLNITKYK